MFDESAPMCRRHMIGLSHGEQLVVWSLRRIVVRQGPDELLLGDWNSVCGRAGEEGLRAFCCFFLRLGQAARRPYEIAPLHALTVAPDELRILTLLGAGQLGEEIGEHALLQAHLAWLAVYVHQPALRRSALKLARLLAAHGCRIALPAHSPVVHEAVCGDGVIMFKPRRPADKKSASHSRDAIAN